jgi:hypothetical protein
VEDMCYAIRRADAGVDESDYHALVNAGMLSLERARVRGKFSFDVCVYYCSTYCCLLLAGPITNLFAWGRRILEDVVDVCYEMRRAKACVD